MVITLPAGPTACFRMSSSKLSHELRGQRNMTGHTPELILSGFTTRLGRRVGRVLGSLFPHVRNSAAPVSGPNTACFSPAARRKPPSLSSPPPLQSPEFEGRRVVTFHNQRDFLFFRQHRYQFTEDGKGVKLLETGPRFTLKLKWLQVSALAHIALASISCHTGNRPVHPPMPAQAGTFDTKFGEYEWYLKRHEMETSRRRFML